MPSALADARAGEWPTGLSECEPDLPVSIVRPSSTLTFFSTIPKLGDRVTTQMASHSAAFSFSAFRRIRKKYNTSKYNEIMMVLYWSLPHHAVPLVVPP
jgi:hypothetical protein